MDAMQQQATHSATLAHTQCAVAPTMGSQGAECSSAGVHGGDAAAGAAAGDVQRHAGGRHSGLGAAAAAARDGLGLCCTGERECAAHQSCVKHSAAHTMKMCSCNEDMFLCCNVRFGHASLCAGMHTGVSTLHAACSFAWRCLQSCCLVPSQRPCLRRGRIRAERHPRGVNAPGRRRRSRRGNPQPQQRYTNSGTEAVAEPRLLLADGSIFCSALASFWSAGCSAHHSCTAQHVVSEGSAAPAPLSGQARLRLVDQVHETAQRILNALAAAPPDVHKALLGVVAPTLEALWQRIMQMVPAIAADVAPSGASVSAFVLLDMSHLSRLVRDASGSCAAWYTGDCLLGNACQSRPRD